MAGLKDTLLRFPKVAAPAASLYRAAKRAAQTLAHRLEAPFELRWNTWARIGDFSRGVYRVEGAEGPALLEVECPSLGEGVRGRLALTLGKTTLVKIDAPIARLRMSSETATGSVIFTPVLEAEAAIAAWRGRFYVLDEYACWIETYEKFDYAEMRRHLETWPNPPKISVVVPVYDTDERWLRRCIDSVREQIYPHWELCLADDASTDPRVRTILEDYQSNDARIRTVFRRENGHVAAASQSALELVTGEYVAFLDHDDELPRRALYEVVKEIRKHPAAEILYSDEDQIDEGGRRFAPHFKTEWSPDLLYSYNLMTHLSVYRRSLIEKIGGFRKGTEGGHDYDLALRACERTEPAHIRHLPQILYHRRAIPGSVGSEKTHAREAARRALRAHFMRTGVQAKIEPGYGQFHRVRYTVHEPPLVEVIIPTRDARPLIERICEGVLDRTDYPNLRLTVVDNGSTDPDTLAFFREVTLDFRVQILSLDRDFNFSALNNAAVRKTQATVLAFLNNDLEVRHADWLMEMVSFAMQKPIGAVGARLLYPDGRVQHAGVLLGLNGGVADHAHRFLEPGAPGYFSRAHVSQEFSSVTAACLVMRRDVFEEVGGFDEALALAYNDIDLCLRVREKGYRVVWTPYAELFHRESATRGSDRTPERRVRLDREAAYLRSRWGARLTEEPFHNPNLSLQGSGFALAFPPRAPSSTL